MGNTYRCIVTGLGSDGKSVVERDSRIPTGALGCSDFWKTSSSPASLSEEWSGSGPIRLEPPANGTIFRFFEIPPQKQVLSADEADRAAIAAFSEAGAGHCRVDTVRNAMM